MIVFCEYSIPEAHRTSFSAWVASGPERWHSAQLLENTGQPGLFVEIWNAEDERHAAQIEEERREGRSWKEMEMWLKGGREGLRIWTFRPVIISG